MMRKKSVKVKKRNELVLSMIKDIKADHPFWGYCRCWAYIYYREGIKVNKKRIYRLMKENDLLVNKKTYRAKRKATRPKPKAYYPNHIWGTDLTKIKIGIWG
jgi:putative transposase